MIEAPSVYVSPDLGSLVPLDVEEDPASAVVDPSAASVDVEEDADDPQPASMETARAPAKTTANKLFFIFFSFRSNSFLSSCVYYDPHYASTLNRENCLIPICIGTSHKK